MKLRIATALILLAIFVLGARAQSNCCVIQTTGPTISGRSGTVVPPSAAGPGGTYIANETDTYGIACVNSQTSNPCNSASMPNNAVTAKGAGANFNGKFVDCSPSFFTHTTQASPSSGAAATFTNDALGWTSVNSNGVCVPMNPQPVTTSTCIVVACSSSPPPPPPPPPDPCCRCLYKGKDETKPTLQKAKAPCCTCDCPIIIDTSGNGFDLTSAASGVKFDMSGTASPVQMSWTAPGSQDAFLCLPDSNGRCDDGKDLFGNFTPQPPSQTPNGFLALAVYDLPVNGGNGDGVIDSNDAIFSRLRLWIDRNHDGISQPDELYTLPALGVYSISLNYKEDRRVDQYGNLFRYRAQINPGGPPGSVGRTVYDVFLLLGSGTITAQRSCPAPQPPRLLPEGKDGRLH